ncbi:hypothetical protein BS47DRAFT_1339838 [Hydnum rufescens UP504]|uniref:Secreted protein n=1 Tax=Hydnum rufescens UP504 TaxID=1448309 RepID=A0A9P6B4H4_9AGAM|nr:hypothetical protein BS47DRAFT_1339838 [Hydnum rufescens UP504]
MYGKLPRPTFVGLVLLNAVVNSGDEITVYNPWTSRSIFRPLHTWAGSRMLYIIVRHRTCGLMFSADIDQESKLDKRLPAEWVKDPRPKRGWSLGAQNVVHTTVTLH